MTGVGFGVGAGVVVFVVSGVVAGGVVVDESGCPVVVFCTVVGVGLGSRAFAIQPIPRTIAMTIMTPDFCFPIGQD